MYLGKRYGLPDEFPKNKIWIVEVRLNQPKPMYKWRIDNGFNFKINFDQIQLLLLLLGRKSEK